MAEETKQNENQEEVKAPQYFLIEGRLANGILQYLGSKPYAEVAGLIDGLKNVQPVNITPPEGEVAEEEEVKG